MRLSEIGVFLFFVNAAFSNNFIFSRFLGNCPYLGCSKEKGVAIAYDSRHMSPEFAQEAALCLAANGIKAYIFETLRPTPELSFAVRHLGCVAGINVTASHNPPEYNGYKVYWEDGAQVVPPHDSGIIAEVQAIRNISEVNFNGNESLISTIGPEMDEIYSNTLSSLSLSPKIIKKP